MWQIDYSKGDNIAIGKTAFHISPSIGSDQFFRCRVCAAMPPFPDSHSVIEAEPSSGRGRVFASSNGDDTISGAMDTHHRHLFWSTCITFGPGGFGQIARVVAIDARMWADSSKHCALFTCDSVRQESPIAKAKTECTQGVDAALSGQRIDDILSKLNILKRGIILTARSTVPRGRNAFVLGLRKHCQKPTCISQSHQPDSILHGLRFFSEPMPREHHRRWVSNLSRHMHQVFSSRG